MVEVLRAAEIQAVVDEKNKIALDVSVHQCIDSTNSWSMAQSKQGRVLPFACFAEQQEQGRGRRGKQWLMKPHANIAMSVSWPFTSVKSLSLLPLSVAIAITQVLEDFGLQQVQVKWPNDVYVQGAKIAGILIETTPVSVESEEASSLAVVIGIGLNFDMDEKVLAQIKSQNQSSAEVTDIRRQFEAQRISMQPTREQVAAGLLSRVLQLCQDFERQAVSSLEHFRADYDFCMDKSIDLILDTDERLSGVGCGVSDSAELIVRLDGSDEIRHFSSAEVSVRAGMKAGL